MNFTGNILLAEKKKPEVWVFAQSEDGRLLNISLELLGKGKELAIGLGGSLAAVLLGDKVKKLSETLIFSGAEKVYLGEDFRLQNYTTLAYTHILGELVQRYKPEILLIGATPEGRDLAPRLASKLKVGLTADCTELKVGSFQDTILKIFHPALLLQIRPALGGNIIATIVSSNTKPQMATVREGVMPLPKLAADNKGEIIPLEVNLESCDVKVEILKRIKAPKVVDLQAAKVIVSGGVGVGTLENFKLIEELAHTLGGEVGASRAAVDAGLASHHHQIGQTGTTVRPRLYIACGISGAVQHYAGMSQAGKIIAVNTDLDAPIFEFAHYGIVGDLQEVIPKMVKAYKSLQENG